MRGIDLSLLFLFFLLLIQPGYAQLKSIIYDFDGLNIGQTDLPEGDYHNFDMNSSISSNPLGQSPMLGDRVIKLSMNWSQGKARFGKGISRFIELSAAADYFNFYIYNPTANASSSKFDITITEDDNKNNTWEDASDDRWKRSVTVTRSSAWQLISLPLSSFTDNNTGGNGIFDAAFTNAAGKIFNIEFNFTRNLSGETSSLVYMDMICFSEGILPTGSSILNLPPKDASDRCILGGFASNSDPQNTPSIIEGLFPSNPKKIEYVNWFMGFSENGTTIANKLPGSEVSQLLQRGYTPVITWEAMYMHLARLDPAQPKLNDFMNGKFDSYIDAFGDKLKSYNDTIIIRFMHEFEGDWYPWSLAHNNQDPNLYINVFRKVVNRIRARGATKVKWMWCVNGPTYHPVLAYNWIKSAYPGSSYVDIVACEAYNLSISGIPYWRSFRAGMAESYYYLRKYFPEKPLFICENGCRERYPEESSASQTKAQWIAQMDQELQSNFHQVKALLFFNIKKSQDYRINSTTASRNSVEANIWNDNYYFKTSGSNTSTTGITMETWTNITGNAISSIPVNSTPGSTSILSIFEAPKDISDNYGRRIRGYVHPPVTGNYTFWISSNNTSELWLSTTEFPENKVKIAFVQDWTNYREWTKTPAQQSVVVYLIAGKKYYIEALHKESTLGDHVSVGWQLPDGTQERPIPGSKLSPMSASGSRLSSIPPATDRNFEYKFAVIGDYGISGANEDAVANLVKSWNPEFIITTGDNNYPDGSAATIDANIGKYYHDFINPYTGTYGNGASVNKFYPTIGNHDLHTTSASPYLEYFTLPGNERYYDFVKGNTHFFALNSDTSELDGFTTESVQGLWLKNKLAASTAKWKIVYFHHSPYCSDAVHGSQPWMQWPFKAWGADAVITGHSHIYERVIKDEFPYLVNGLGGQSKYSLSANPIADSHIRYNANYGAMLTMVKVDTIWFKFYNVNNELIDNYSLVKANTEIKKAEIPLVPQITVTGPTELSKDEKTILSVPFDSSAVYLWKRDDVTIANENKNSLNVLKAGAYKVKMMKNGTISYSDIIEITGREDTDTIADTDLKEETTLKVFPNPNNGIFTIVLNMNISEGVNIKMIMLNNLGQIVYTKEFFSSNRSISETIELDKSAPPGVYTLQVIIGTKTESTSILLTR